MTLQIKHPVEVSLAIVRPSGLQGAWQITVDHDGEEYASVFAPTLDVALRMVLPYIASVAEPDMFASLLAQARAIQPGDGSGSLRKPPGSQR